MLSLEQFLWMSEQEGQDQWVTTDAARINACVNDFIDYHYKGYNINSEGIQDMILRKHGFSLKSITDKECRYIMQEVERKIR